MLIINYSMLQVFLVFEEHLNGFHKPQDIDNRVRMKIMYYHGFMDKLYHHSVYGLQLKTELRKFSEKGL